jgi:hypothetical protein
MLLIAIQNKYRYPYLRLALMASQAESSEYKSGRASVCQELQIPRGGSVFIPYADDMCVAVKAT